jgi:hypothetical protein
MALNLNSCGHCLKSLARDGDRLFKAVGVSRPDAFWEVMRTTIRDRCDTNDIAVTSRDTRYARRTTDDGVRPLRHFAKVIARTRKLDGVSGGHCWDRRLPCACRRDGRPPRRPSARKGRSGVRKDPRNVHPGTPRTDGRKVARADGIYPSGSRPSERGHPEGAKASSGFLAFLSTCGHRLHFSHGMA